MGTQADRPCHTGVNAGERFQDTGLKNLPSAGESKMSDSKRHVTIAARAVPPRTKPSNYPEPYFSRMTKREQKPLGDFFGLKNFGVNLTKLVPGGESALLHSHSKQDEMIYVLEGEPTLVVESGETMLAPGMCTGFPAQARRITWSTAPARTL